MTTLARLALWKQSGAITNAQFGVLSGLVRKERFSVFLELNALLYIGVLSLAAGLGWTVQKYFTNLGDTFILLSLSAMLAGALFYCFSRGHPYSSERIESPNLIFDYVLYLGCLVLSVELGYIEFRFELLKNAWDNYLLISTAVFFVLAYRFDNRFVLSLGLSSLAGWFGLRLSRAGFISADSLRISALTYGAIVALSGIWIFSKGIKEHFLEAYLHVATVVILGAVISGLGEWSAQWTYLAALLVLSATAIVMGIRFRRFAFVAYGTVYAYAGVSYVLLRTVNDFKIVLMYLVLTGTAVIISLAMVARRFGREE